MLIDARFVLMIVMYSGFWILYFQQFGSVLWYLRDFVDREPVSRAVTTLLHALGLNVRFVVANRAGKPAAIFAWYNARGQAENFIKDLKCDVAADRLSCHGFRANALRLQLHALAYNLLVLFRQHALAATVLARATLGTVRLRLFKVGARVRHTARHLWVHLATGWPGQALYRAVWATLHRLRAAPA